METQFDQDYVQRLIARDPATEEHFIRYFGQLIRVVVLARAGAWRLVEDVRQETFLRVLRILHEQGGLERPERLGAFVYSVCRRVLAEQLREESEGFGAGQGEPNEPGYHMLVDERLIRRENRREVERALEALTPVERQALRLIFLEERDRRQVGRLLGLSPDYLRVVLCRAKAHLRKRLASREDIFSLESSRYNGTSQQGETRRRAKITDH